MKFAKLVAFVNLGAFCKSNLGWWWACEPQQSQSQTAHCFIDTKKINSTHILILAVASTWSCWGSFLTANLLHSLNQQWSGFYWRFITPSDKEISVVTQLLSHFACPTQSKFKCHINRATFPTSAITNGFDAKTNNALQTRLSHRNDEKTPSHAYC